MTKASDGEGEVRRAISARQMATGKGFTALECIWGVGRSWWGLGGRVMEKVVGRRDCGIVGKGKGKRGV